MSILQKKKDCKCQRARGKQWISFPRAPWAELLRATAKRQRLIHYIVMSSHTNLHSAFHCFDMQMRLKKAKALRGGAKRVYVFGERREGVSNHHVLSVAWKYSLKLMLPFPLFPRSYLSIGSSHPTSLSRTASHKKKKKNPAICRASDSL